MKTLYARILQQVYKSTPLTWTKRRGIDGAVRKALALQERADRRRVVRKL